MIEAFLLGLKLWRKVSFRDVHVILYTRYTRETQRLTVPPTHHSILPTKKVELRQFNQCRSSTLLVLKPVYCA